MLLEIIADLGDNYNPDDKQILKDIIDEVTTSALSISNNKVDNLIPEIKLCVKQVYLQRGLEDSQSKNESGESSTLIDPYENLRKNIIRNGKRHLF